jgi:hypothetical protein
MEKDKTTDTIERPVWVCTTRSFYANRFSNPGDCVRAKKCPGPPFRLFDPARDKATLRVADIPAEN